MSLRTVRHIFIQMTNSYRNAICIIPRFLTGNHILQLKSFKKYLLRETFVCTICTYCFTLLQLKMFQKK